MIRLDFMDPIIKIHSIDPLDITGFNDPGFFLMRTSLWDYKTNHIEDAKTVIILEPTGLKEMIHLQYVSYFTYDTILKEAW